MNELNINLTFSDIKLLNKSSFKKLVKERISVHCLNFLMQEKAKQSKCCDIAFDTLSMQNHFHLVHLTTQQMMLLFQMRSQSFPVLSNVKFLNPDTTCPCCGLADDTMSHQLQCIVLTNSDLVLDTSVNISDIYHNNVTA